jgi:hypothetical protein
MFRIPKSWANSVELSCKHVHIARRDPTEELSRVESCDLKPAVRKAARTSFILRDTAAACCVGIKDSSS